MVHLTVYNKDGGVIGTDETYAEPSTLKAGQKSTFEIFADTDDFKGMDYYELSLEWLNHRDSSQGYVENAKIYKDNTATKTETETEADNSLTSRGDNFQKTRPLCDTVTNQSAKDLCETLMN